MSGRGFKLAGVKVTKATAAVAAQLGIGGDQSTDLTSLTSPLPAPAPAVVAKAKPFLGAVSKAAGPKVAEPKAAAKAAESKAKASAKASAKAPTKTRIIAELAPEDQEKALAILGTENDDPYRIKNPIYPLQSRLGFNRQILKVFEQFIKVPEHGKALDYDACKRLSAAAGQQVEMYEYQKFVRDYIRQATPYRGLLVYHGLGSGKTCSAIAAAEAMYSVSKKRIIVMTPFSLRDNFLREVTFCGFRHFRLQNHWVALPKSPTSDLFATEILNLPADFVAKAEQIWVPDFDQAPNLSDLEPEERTAIQKQLLAQINARITFINYNGISAAKLKEMACSTDEQGPFDNAIIVVDEIHNLTRLMQGTIEPYLMALATKKSRTIPLEPIDTKRWVPALCKKAYDPRRPYQTNYKRGYLLYRMLATARNSKIIGLSGTPLINFPEELAILMNLLGGYIHTASFTASPGGDATLRTLQSLARDHPFIDFESCVPLGVGIKVLLTLLPAGVKKVRDADGVLGAQRLAEDELPMTIEEAVAEIIASAATKGITVRQPPVFSAEPLLPPVGDEFRKVFLTPDGMSLTNTSVLRKRIQGLISYYRGSKKELMPTVTKDELVRVPFSPYAQTAYSAVRGQEIDDKRKQTEQAQGDAAQQAAAGSRVANLWAELYDLAKMKSPNSYRMASRQACNFAFPEGIVRPRPRNQADAEVEVGRKEDETKLDVQPDRALAEEEEEEEIVLPQAEGEGEGQAAAEDAAFEEDEEADEVEAAKGQAAPLPQEPVLVGELPPAPEAAAAPAGPGDALSAAAQAKIKQAADKELCKVGYREGEVYMSATKRAKRCLEVFAAGKLRMYPPGPPGTIRKEAAAGTVPDPTRLASYSPKFAAILTRVLEAPGSSLVYSQFLDMEGIGIFLTVLRINEFAPIKLEPDGANSFVFSADTLKSLNKPNVFRYLSFTGSETREQRAMALRVFNARYDSEKQTFPDLPEAMSKALREATIPFTGNLHGELCRVFCITSAGAEGLSLRNVRRVHIMEPYWNPVRTDQVKGRAVRICSHIDLEYSDDPTKNERTVEVFTYCSAFHPSAMKSGSSTYPAIDQTIVGADGLKPDEAKKMDLPIPDGVKDYIMTSDEYLYVLSEGKKKLLKGIQDLMKTSAVDCQLNSYENEEEGLACVTLPGSPDEYAFHPDLSRDIAESSATFGSAAAPGAAPLAQGSKPQEPPKPQGPRAIEVIYDAKPYLAFPIIEKGKGLPVRYNIYDRGDLKRIKKIGTGLAGPDGKPTQEIVFF